MSEGLVEVRQSNVRQSELVVCPCTTRPANIFHFLSNRGLANLVRLEADAKAQNKGKWAKTIPTKVKNISLTLTERGEKI